MFAPIRTLWKAVFHRGSWERDLRDELQAHLEYRADDLVRGGLTRAEALRQARIEFGAAESFKEDCRQAHGLRWFEEFRQDLRYVVRTLRRSPAFTSAAVLSLALGIGANAVVFSVANALLLKPLPIERPSEVYFVQPEGNPNHSFPNYRDLRDRNRTMASLAAYRIAIMSLDDSAGAQRLWGYLATGNYFDLLGVRPIVGRFFHPTDDRERSASPYAVLSYRCWRQRFAGDPRIAGRTVRINGFPYTVLGVAPPEFHGTELFYWPDIWVPMTMEPRIEAYDTLDARPAHTCWVIGRLKPGATRQQSAADLTSISMDLAREYPNVNPREKIGLARPGMVGDTLRGPTQAFTTGIMALACLVLLAVCANLASLLAARATDRSRELAIRLSIGAGRGRIVRQLLTESLVLAALGGLAGWGLALLLSGLLSQWKPPLDFPAWVEIRPDVRVFLFSAAISLAAGILSGLAPSRQAWKSDPNHMLKGAPAGGRGWRRLPLRDALVGVQVAICCALVACSFVSIRGLSRAFSTSLGLQPRGAAVVSFDLDLARYKRVDGRQFQRRALEAVSRIPGVTAAAFTNTLPLNVDQSSTPLYRESTTEFRPENSIGATIYNVSPGYFRTAGTRLLQGREFDWHDERGGPPVAIVNQRLAKLLTGPAPAVGRHFRFGRGPLVEIVGVVEDGKYSTLTEAPEAAVFQASTQAYDGATMLLARSSLPEAALAAQMREAVAALDPHLPLYGAGAMSDVLQMAFLPSRAAVIALSAFGILALTLAVTGIYGLCAYSVSRRVREIGIRVAIGAEPRQVLACVLRQMAWLVGGGACAGLVLAWSAGRILAAVVYQASPRDPVILGATAVTLAAAGLLASVGPARRALGINPSTALRQD